MPQVTAWQGSKTGSFYGPSLEVAPKHKRLRGYTKKDEMMNKVMKSVMDNHVKPAVEKQYKAFEKVAAKAIGGKVSNQADFADAILGISKSLYQTGTERKKVADDLKSRNKNVGTNYTMPYNTTRTGRTSSKSTRIKTTRKKATNRKNVGNIKKSKPKTLRTQVTQLAKKVNMLTSKHTHRYADAGVVQSNNAECDHLEVAPVTPTLIQGYTDNLRFYDSTAGALDTADPTTLTASHDLKFKNIYSKLSLKNSHMVPVNVKVYLCKLKHDTAAGVLSEYTNILADQCTTAGADTESIMMYLTDAERLRENWNIDCVIDKRLVHGQMCSTSHSTGEFDWDASHVDYDTDYQTGYKYFLWVIRINGDIAHDSVNATTETGIGSAGVDYMIENKAEILYNSGGPSLNDFSFNDQRQATFTNSSFTGVVNTPDNVTRSAT